MYMLHVYIYILEPALILTKSYKEEDIYPNWNACHLLKQWTHKTWQDPDCLPGHKEDRIMLQNILGMDENSKPLQFILLLDFILACKVIFLFILLEYSITRKRT